MNDFTSFRSLMRRMRAATKAAKVVGGAVIDSMTSMQVADHAELSTAALIAKVDEVGPRAARWRAKAPALFRMIPMKEEVGGEVETWRMGYLLDVILTRDPWMHRVDTARATSREIVLTPDHDGRIIADVVAEWARRHGQPYAHAHRSGGRRVRRGLGVRSDLDRRDRVLSSSGGPRRWCRPARPRGPVLTRGTSESG